MQSSKQLCVNLFATLRLTYGGNSVAGLQTDRYQSLVAYLVLKARTPQSRSHLATLFWPDTTETKAKTSLRRELFRLRQVLPDADQFLQVTPQTIQWHPQYPFWLDVTEFEAKIAQAAEQQPALPEQVKLLKQAVELYQGPLLPACYDDWIVPERQRLHQLMVNALTDLGSMLAKLGDYRGAIAHTQQLLQLAPLNESGYLTLIRLHAKQGDRAAALTVYHQCMTLLRNELGIDPGAEIQTLYQTLLDDTVTPLTGSFSAENAVRHSTPRRQRSLPWQKINQCQLVGRDQEWQTIQTWFLEQSSNLLLLLGEPGIGKTRLLEELATFAQTQSSLVLWGQGFEAELLRPYGAWIDALRGVTAAELTDDLPAELSGLLPELKLPAPPMTNRGQLFDAVITLISEITTSQAPLLLILDDIQWLDDASVALLHYGVRVLGKKSLQVACSARSQTFLDNPAVATLIQSLQRDRKLQPLTLAPLDQNAILSLVISIDTHDDDQVVGDQAARIYTDSGGNPLFAIAAARTLNDPAKPDVSNLDLLIRERLKRLPDTAQSLLPWASALGHSFDPMILTDIANCSIQQLFSDLETLEHASILSPGNNSESYTFAHDLVRQSIYQQISAPRRRLMHQTIADYLNRRYGNDAAQMVNVVHHATIAQNSELVVQAALIAAQHSLTLFAFGEATELAQQGLAHCHSLELQTRVSQQLELLKVRVLAGVSRDELDTVAEQIQVGIRAAQALDLHNAEATGQDALLSLNYDQEQLDDLEHHALAVIERAKRVHPSTSARLLAYSGACLATLMQDMDRAEAILLEAKSLADRVSLKIWNIYHGLGAVYRYQGRTSMAHQHLEIALQLSQKEHQEQQLCCITLTEKTMLATEQQQWSQVIEACHQLIPLADKLTGGSEAALSKALNALAHYGLETISLKQLETAIQELIDLDAQRKLAFVLSHWAALELARKNSQTALVKAQAALDAAQVVGNVSDVAIAWALTTQATIANGTPLDRQQIQTRLTKMGNQSLSHWAHQQLARLRKLLESRGL